MRMMALAVLLMPLSVAAGSLANFKAGQYKLIQGQEKQCGPGNFKMRDDGKGVLLGPLHGFDIQAGASVTKSDIPDFAGCIYENRSTVKIEGTTTILADTEVLRCGPGDIRHTLDRTAKITKDRVELKINQAGNPDFGDQEPSYSYLCVWTSTKTGAK